MFDCKKHHGYQPISYKKDIIYWEHHQSKPFLGKFFSGKILPKSHIADVEK